MIDYRPPAARTDYFDALYEINLTHRIMPGLVYLYLPELRARLQWTDEQALWFAFLNGNTQNPITSLTIFQQIGPPPHTDAQIETFVEWFNGAWDTLQFDTDRRYQKKELPDSIRAYSRLTRSAGSQLTLFRNRPFRDVWDMARGQMHSFGRLGAWSYLEYVHLLGYGPQVDAMMYDDKDGSKSHRNGMLFLLGYDHLVWDKRTGSGFDGEYGDFPSLCRGLEQATDAYLTRFATDYPHTRPGRFTFESQLCQFKNGFFRRRYPGVYADMAWDRIVWAEERGNGATCSIFKDIRADCLPPWLRLETEDNPIPRAQAAAAFADTGIPHRAEHFLPL